MKGKTWESNYNVGNRRTHPCIDAALSLVEGNTIRPGEVEEIVAHVSESSYVLLGRPFEIGENPQVDAQFSIPYTVSVAIARRGISIDDFFEDTIKANAQVLQLTKKVKVVADQELIAKGITPCIVEIRTKDGKVHSQRVDVIRGDPRNPVGMVEVSEKFRKCATFSVKPMSERNIEQAVKVIGQLENVESITEITKLLT